METKVNLKSNYKIKPSKKYKMKFNFSVIKCKIFFSLHPESTIEIRLSTNSSIEEIPETYSVIFKEPSKLMPYSIK